MSIFNFFKKKEKTGKDSTIDSAALLEKSSGTAENNELLKPVLSLPTQWKISKEQEYVLRFLSNELPPLKQNQISLAGITTSLNQDNRSMNVEAFIRSSLTKPVKLGNTELLLLDNQNKLIASQKFDLASIGEIPGNSNFPWIFEFHEQNIKSYELPSEGWKLAFNLKSLMKHSLDMDTEWKEKLSLDDQQHLTKLVESLPPLKPEELNITGFQAKLTDEETLVVSILIRNGSDKNVQLNKVPLEIRDANEATVAKGVFELTNFTVKSNTTKPWTFIFPKETVLIAQPDMSKWKALIIQ
ncbi:accessory Sec system S-layer assembly protein [Metaplanococcus flavidus]|uniref:Accessory Sec system S-layer assembly protein n=1 Tax=Metaplanococcus flavidus TaxID=569883 RepID=A0ABW3L9F5_9BACL